MDQSLLLGIEENTVFKAIPSSIPGIYDISPEEEVYFWNRHRFMSEDRKFIYHIAIIDYLQDFNLNKKMEFFLKGIRNGSWFAEYSCVPPSWYQERFVKFMD